MIIKNFEEFINESEHIDPKDHHAHLVDDHTKKLKKYNSEKTRTGKTKYQFQRNRLNKLKARVDAAKRRLDIFLEKHSHLK